MKYKFLVQATIDFTVVVEAENEDEAYDLVSDADNEDSLIRFLSPMRLDGTTEICLEIDKDLIIVGEIDFCIADASPLKD